MQDLEIMPCCMDLLAGSSCTAREKIAGGGGEVGANGMEKRDKCCREPCNGGTNMHCSIHC